MAAFYGVLYGTTFVAIFERSNIIRRVAIVFACVPAFAFLWGLSFMIPWNIRANELLGKTSRPKDSDEDVFATIGILLAGLGIQYFSLEFQWPVPYGIFLFGLPLALLYWSMYQLLKEKYQTAIVTFYLLFPFSIFMGAWLAIKLNPYKGYLIAAGQQLSFVT